MPFAFKFGCIMGFKYQFASTGLSYKGENRVRQDKTYSDFISRSVGSVTGKSV